MDFNKVLLILNKLNSDIYLGGFYFRRFKFLCKWDEISLQKISFFFSKNLNNFISLKVSYFLFGKRYDRSARKKLRELSSSATSIQLSRTIIMLILRSFKQALSTSESFQLSILSQRSLVCFLSCCLSPRYLHIPGFSLFHWLIPYPSQGIGAGTGSKWFFPLPRLPHAPPPPSRSVLPHTRLSQY